MIGACSTIIAINIFQINETEEKKIEFFKELKKLDEKYDLNCNLWNNA